MKPLAIPTAVTAAAETVRSGEICRVTGEITLLALDPRLTVSALFVMAPGCRPGGPLPSAWRLDPPAIGRWRPAAASASRTMPGQTFGRWARANAPIMVAAW